MGRGMQVVVCCRKGKTLLCTAAKEVVVPGRQLQEGVGL